MGYKRITTPNMITVIVVIYHMGILYTWLVDLKRRDWETMNVEHVNLFSTKRAHGLKTYYYSKHDHGYCGDLPHGYIVYMVGRP